MTLTRWLCLGLLALTGCQRDPVFVGYWEIARVERGGAVQSDVGFMDFDGDGEVVVFTRYLHDGAAWVPDPSPIARESGCDVFEQDDIFEAYKEEGETYGLTIDLLSPERMKLDEYHPWRAEVGGPALSWPGSQTTLPTTVVLRR
jgi:hypothetical protein